MQARRLYLRTVCLSVAMTAWAAGGALAQQGKGDPDDPMDLGPAFQRVAFDAADTDGDSLISEGEFARDAAAAFAKAFKAGDKSGDGKLSYEEMVESVKAE